MERRLSSITAMEAELLIISRLPRQSAALSALAILLLIPTLIRRKVARCLFVTARRRDVSAVFRFDFSFC